MNKIAGFVKKNRWFKLGKWKEPVFLQDIIIRSYLEKKKDIVLPYHSNMALTVGFKQFMRLAEYEELKQKGFERVAICGGASIYTLWLKEKLVDEIWVTVQPVIFGQGIIPTSGVEMELELLSQEDIGEGVVVVKYKVI